MVLSVLIASIGIIEYGLIFLVFFVVFLLPAGIIPAPPNGARGKPTSEEPSNNPEHTPLNVLYPFLRLFATPFLLGVYLDLSHPSWAVHFLLFVIACVTTFIGVYALMPRADFGEARRQRYEIVLHGLSIFWLSQNTDDGVMTWLIMMPSLSILCGVPIFYFFRSLRYRVVDGGRRLPGRALQAWYAFLQPLGVVLAAASLVILPIPIATLYLLARFFVGQRMAEAPCLYLRSFSHDGVAKAFGKIVGPGLASSAVVIGLAHVTQTAQEVNRRAHPLYRARLRMVPDEQWKEWVEDQLRVCSAVVLDMTITTPGVTWELERCLEVMPAERIAVLINDGDALALPDVVTIVACSPNWLGRRRAARMLKRWMRWLRLFT